MLYLQQSMGDIMRCTGDAERSHRARRTTRLPCCRPWQPPRLCQRTEVRCDTVMKRSCTAPCCSTALRNCNPSAPIVYRIGAQSLADHCRNADLRCKQSIQRSWHLESAPGQRTRKGRVKYHCSYNNLKDLGAACLFVQCCALRSIVEHVMHSRGSNEQAVVVGMFLWITRSQGAQNEQNCLST